MTHGYDDARIHLTRTDDNLTVRIKSVKHLYVVFFIATWLVVWAAGLYLILVVLPTGKDLPFMLAWLFVWILSGIVIVFFSLWNFFGREVIEIRNNVLSITRKIPFWSRKRRYDVTRIKALRPDPGLERQLYTNQVPPPNIFSGWAKGAVKFNYGKKTIGFGMELDSTEAQQLAVVVHKMLKRMRGQ